MGGFLEGVDIIQGDDYFSDEDLSSRLEDRGFNAEVSDHILVPRNVCLGPDAERFDVPEGMGVWVDVSGRVEILLQRVEGGGIKAYRSFQEYDYFTPDDLRAGVFIGRFPIFKGENAAYSRREGVRSLLVSDPNLDEEEIMILGNEKSLWFADMKENRNVKTSSVCGPYKSEGLIVKDETVYGSLTALKEEGGKFLYHDVMSIDLANLADHWFQIGKTEFSFEMNIHRHGASLDVKYRVGDEESRLGTGPLMIPNLIRDGDLSGEVKYSLPVIVVGREFSGKNFWEIPIQLGGRNVDGRHACFVINPMQGKIVVYDVSRYGTLVRGPSAKYLSANTRESVERTMANSDD